MQGCSGEEGGPVTDEEWTGCKGREFNLERDSAGLPVVKEAQLGSGRRMGGPEGRAQSMW